MRYLVVCNRALSGTISSPLKEYFFLNMNTTWAKNLQNFVQLKMKTDLTEF